MSAPTNVQDMGELTARLQHLIAEVASVSAEIASVAQVNATQTASGGEGQGVGAVLTLTQAAQLLGRSRSWVHEQVRRNKIPSVRIGSRWWIRRADLVAGGWL